jgi:hypothetical protein
LTFDLLTLFQQTCANNMLAADKAEELGCKQNDLKCLCANKNFLYGLRDCSAAICSAEDARKVVEYGISVCACRSPSRSSYGISTHSVTAAGVAIQTSSGGGVGSASNTGSASGPIATTPASGSAAVCSSPARIIFHSSLSLENYKGQH